MSPCRRTRLPALPSEATAGRTGLRERFHAPCRTPLGRRHDAERWRTPMTPMATPEARAPRELAHRVSRSLRLHAGHAPDGRRRAPRRRRGRLLRALSPGDARARGGTVVKFIGDGALLVFPVDRADACGGSRCSSSRRTLGRVARCASGGSRRARNEGAIRLGHRRLLRRARRQALWTSSATRVNVAARLATRSFALSAEAFRRPSPAARQRFKKHTPPITYIPVEDRTNPWPRPGATSPRASSTACSTSSGEHGFLRMAL